jgi:hypothetical protein
MNKKISVSLPLNKYFYMKFFLIDYGEDIEKEYEIFNLLK